MRHGIFFMNICVTYMRNFFESKAVSLKTILWSILTTYQHYIIVDFFIFFCFSPYPCGMSERQELFLRNFFTHQTWYAYFGWWAVGTSKNIWIFLKIWKFGRILSRWWSILRDFPPFCILAPRNQTCQLFNCSYLQFNATMNIVSFIGLFCKRDLYF